MWRCPSCCHVAGAWWCPAGCVVCRWGGRAAAAARGARRQDGDFSEARFRDTVNAALANNIGNMMNRSLNLLKKNCASQVGAAWGASRSVVLHQWGSGAACRCEDGAGCGWAACCLREAACCSCALQHGVHTCLAAACSALRRSRLM